MLLRDEGVNQERAWLWQAEQTTGASAAGAEEETLRPGEQPAGAGTGQKFWDIEQRRKPPGLGSLQRGLEPTRGSGTTWCIGCHDVDRSFPHVCPAWASMDVGARVPVSLFGSLLPCMATDISQV